MSYLKDIVPQQQRLKAAEWVGTSTVVTGGGEMPEQRIVLPSDGLVQWNLLARALESMAQYLPTYGVSGCTPLPGFV